MPDKNRGVSRRRFLTAAAAGLASAGLAKVAPAGATTHKSDGETEEAGRSIIRRRLGRSGSEIPIVSMGMLSGANPEIIQASYEIGMRHFNASSYLLGQREVTLGLVINRLKVRDKVQIATGTGSLSAEQGLTAKELRKKLIAGCHASLRRLGSDYLDLLYFHDLSSRREVNNPGILEGMHELKDQKKILMSGVSTHSRMAEVIDEAVNTESYDVVQTAINFTMADDTVLLDAIKRAADRGIAVVAMKTMAGGTRWPNPQTRKDYSESTIATAALKWAMRNENIATSVPGYTNYEHMKEDFSIAYDLEYTEKERQFLSDNRVRLGIGFCRQCRLCLASCPNGVDIPRLMRSHMYAVQYGNLHQARATLDERGGRAGLSVCTDCRNCQAECANTVDIARRIEDLRTLCGPYLTG